MGADIHSFAEKRTNGKWEKVGDHFSLDEYDRKHYKKEKGDSPFDHRNYSVFAFLADVRNYDHCEPISQPRRLPTNSDWLNSPCEDVDIYSSYKNLEVIESNFDSIINDYDYHSHSYLTLKELLDFDYDKTFWNRRVSKQTGPNSWTGAALAEEGEGTIISYRENLGSWFFKHLEELKQLGEPEDVRIVFWFDN